MSGTPTPSMSMARSRSGRLSISVRGRDVDEVAVRVGEKGEGAVMVDEG